MRPKPTRRPSEEENGSFLGRVEYARKQRGLSKQKLEEDAKLATGWLSKNRGKHPWNETIEQLATALHVHEAWLRTGAIPELGWEAIFDELAAEMARRGQLDLESPPASRPRHLGHAPGRKRPVK